MSQADPPLATANFAYAPLVVAEYPRVFFGHFSFRGTGFPLIFSGFFSGLMVVARVLGGAMAGILQDSSVKQSPQIFTGNTGNRSV